MNNLLYNYNYCLMIGVIFIRWLFDKLVRGISRWISNINHFICFRYNNLLNITRTCMLELEIINVGLPFQKLEIRIWKSWNVLKLKFSRVTKKDTSEWMMTCETTAWCMVWIVTIWSQKASYNMWYRRKDTHNMWGE